MNHVPQTATKTSSLLVAVVAPLLVFALGACDGASSPGDGAKASGGAAAEACDPVTGTGGGIYLPNPPNLAGLRAALGLSQVYRRETSLLWAEIEKKVG